MYSPHSLYTPHQASQGVKSSGLYTEKYGIQIEYYLIFISCLLYNIKFAMLFISPSKELKNEMCQYDLKSHLQLWNVPSRQNF